MTDEKTPAEQFGEAMHKTLTRLEKAERAAKRSSEYADQSVRTANEYVRKFNETNDELTKLRAIVAAMSPAEQAEIEAETTKPPLKPLRCIVCDFQPESIGNGANEVPYAATMFDAGSGHYGSTVWDTMSGYRSLNINVCDKCLVERKDRIAVVERTPAADRYEWAPWNPEAD